MNLLRKFLREPFWVIFALAVVWYVGTMSTACFWPDWKYIESWAANIQTNGLTHAYVGTPQYNYPPLMAYALWLFGKGIPDAASLKDSLYLFKFLPLAFDFVAAVLAVKWAGDRRREAIYLLVLVANPVYVFESLTWGQIDSTYCALVFFSLYAALKDRPVASALLYTLAFNFKIQALLFAPLFGLVWLWKFSKPWPLRRVALAWGASGVLQLAIVLPFVLAGQFGHMLNILKNPVNYYRSISMNAFNFWHFFYGHRSYKMEDTVTVFGGISAQQAGLALFFGFSLLILAPPFYRIIKTKIRHEAMYWSEESLLLMFAVIPLVFFFFCTQMHERYSQPAILFVAAYTFRTRRYYLLVLMFMAYGLNMDYVYEGMVLEGWQVVVYNSQLIAGLYAALIAALLWYYFRALPKPGAKEGAGLTAPANPPPAGAP